MARESKIEWTDATWNPVTGCSHVSPGCENCYAERTSLRRKWSTKPWTTPNAAENIVLYPDRLDQPLRWRKPRLVFVNSMSDLFHELVPDEFIARVFSVMGRATRHTFQVLTKRPDRMHVWLRRCANAENLGWITHDGTPPAKVYDGTGIVLSASDNWPLRNVWLGVSLEDQRRAGERIPLLLETPAVVRFISAEPLLGAINLEVWLMDRPPTLEQVNGSYGHYYIRHGASWLDWVIVGGESGPKARHMELGWASDIVEQCRQTRVPVFVKQLSQTNGQKYKDFESFPEELRVREYPECV